MAEPFLSEIRIFTFNFPPKGWAFCNGQFMQINQNQALFSLLGTTFGGNGQTTFALPNFQGRVPTHVGNGFTLGQNGGEQAHTLTQQELPTHNHTWTAMTPDGTSNNPSGLAFAKAQNNLYGATPDTPMNPSTVSNAGGSQPHQNMQPYLVLSFCIALQGIFPSPN
jgi:microcystin-dependent protein